MVLNRFVRSLLTSFVAASLAFGAISCSKDDDDDDEGENIAADQLMVDINVGCGGGNCIAKSTGLYIGSDETFVQTIRGFFWLVMGFPGEDSYDSFVPKGATDVVPTDGMVGRIEGARENVVSLILDNYSGITSCAKAPTSGSLEVGDATITFGEAQNAAPASFPKTGTYDKRAVLVDEADGFTASFEWFCDYGGMMAKYEQTIDGETFHYAFFYDREDENDGHFEFYLFDDTGTISSDPSTLGLKVNVLEDTFTLATTRTGVKDGSYFGYRAAGNSNFESQETSLFYHDIANSPLTKSQWNASDDVSDTSVEGDSAPSTGGEDKKQGCAKSFDTAAHTISSMTLCDDLDLEEPEAPGLDEDGNWSMKWIHANVEDLLKALE